MREALAALQVAVRELMAAVPGVAGSRPVDVMAALSIDLKLAWKFARIAQSGDPFAIVRHLPGAAGWRIAMDAARTAGAPQASVARSARAFDDAVRLGTTWAGDRKGFDMMAAGLTAGSDLRIDAFDVRAARAHQVDVLMK